MTTMMSEVYDALFAAGAPDDKARQAAEAMATHEPPFSRIRSDLRVLKVQLAGLYAVVTLIGAPALWLLVRVAAKAGAVG